MSQLLAFAKLGKLVRGVHSVDFARRNGKAMDTEMEMEEDAEEGDRTTPSGDSYEVYDPGILKDIQDRLEREMGQVKALVNVSVDDSDTFRGNAIQPISLGRSQVYEFEVGDRIRYKLTNADEIASYIETDEGFSDIVEYAVKAGKKLQCKSGNMQCGGKCQSGKQNCFVEMSPDEKKAIQSAARKAKKLAGNKVGDLSKSDLEGALLKKFGVSSMQELRNSNSFKMANSGRGVPNGNELRQTDVLAEQYRRHVGVIPNDPANSPEAYGSVNGINVFKYDRPWNALGLDPQTATQQDIKTAYRNLSRQYHPDNRDTGDREIFERINLFYESLTQRF